MCFKSISTHAAMFLAIYILLSRFWSLGDIISDIITTRAYYKYWREPNDPNNTSSHLWSEDAYHPTPNSSVYRNESKPWIFPPWFEYGYIWDKGNPGFFFFAIVIWILTPLWYSIAIYRNVLIGVFSFEKLEEISEDDKWKKFAKFFMSFLRMHLTTISPYHFAIKLCIFCLPPIGTIFFLTCFIFSTLMAYLYFPLSAIIASFHEIMNFSKNDNETNFEDNHLKYSRKITPVRNYNIYINFMKTKTFLTQQILNETDINSLQFCEALCESLFQCFLAMHYYWKTTKSKVENIEFTTDNIIIICSMMFSIVTITRVFGTMIVYVLQLKYGKDFYRRLKSISFMDYVIVFTLISMLLTLIVAFLYIVT